MRVRRRSRRPTTWKPRRAPSEIVKAVLAAGGVVVLTVAAIFLLKPDTESSTPGPAPLPAPSVVPSTEATSSSTTAGATPSTPAQP